MIKIRLLLTFPTTFNLIYSELPSPGPESGFCSYGKQRQIKFTIILRNRILKIEKDILLNLFFIIKIIPGFHSYFDVIVWFEQNGESSQRKWNSQITSAVWQSIWRGRCFTFPKEREFQAILLVKCIGNGFYLNWITLIPVNFKNNFIYF